MDAAETWALAKSGRVDRRKAATVDEGIQSEFAQLGVKVEQDEAPEGEATPVAAENWRSVLAFMACETQWQVTGTMSQLFWIGLKYADVIALLESEGMGREIFRDIRIMEAAALPILNEAD